MAVCLCERLCSYQPVPTWTDLECIIMVNKRSRVVPIILSLCLILFFNAFSDRPAHSQSPPPTGEWGLLRAEMCEDVSEQKTKNTGIAFSVGIGKVHCFTFFDPVPQKESIYHNWYHREKLSTKIKLRLNSPRWATFSSIQLREADKGPWRVEITDPKGRVLRVLRFSIVD